MKLKNVWNNIKFPLFVLSIPITLNYTITSMGTAIYFSENISVNEVPQETYDKYETSNKEFGVFDYLNISNSISCQVADSGDVCNEYASTTYDIYQKLTEMNCRKDLEYKVRKVWGGYEKSKKEKMRHIWIEFFEEGEWKPYEPTNKKCRTPTNLNWETVKDYSESNKEIKSEINITDPAQFKTLPGKNFVYPLFYSFISYPSFLDLKTRDKNKQ